MPALRIGYTINKSFVSIGRGPETKQVTVSTHLKSWPFELTILLLFIIIINLIVFYSVNYQQIKSRIS